MRLRTHMLWREPGSSQVYTDPDAAVVLGDLSAEEQEFLDSLEKDASESTVRARARALGLSNARVDELLGVLDEWGALEHHRDPRLDHDGLGAEVDHWSRALRRDAHDVLTARRRSVVGVLGLGRIGLLLASGLAAAGVGTVLTEDRVRVRREDVGPGGYSLGDVGAARGERARALLRLTYPHLRTSAPARTRPDLVVLVDQDVSNPLRLRPLLREDIAHLLVVARELDVVVGPLIRPGVGPCGRCLELHRTDDDDRWPALATQLLGSPVRGVEASVAMAAAASAVGQVLAHLDGRPVATTGAALVHDPRHAAPRTQQWPVHPECGCTGLPTAVEPVGQHATSPARW